MIRSLPSGKLKSLCFLLITLLSGNLFAQHCYWQQKALYKMDIDFDTEKHQFHGKQTVTYFNNSPDTLEKIYYHLYFNAFQPGSMMDVRSRTISDPDDRIGDRISQLREEETGYHKIAYVKQDGKKTSFRVIETIMEVRLAKPLLPGSKTELEMEFDSQVPIQIRRSGRSNKEGIAYSMTQWYPKVVEYDKDGWHPNPYIGREFHGVWGDFDITIHIDSAYTIGGTGYLQNPQEIGKGYEDTTQPLKLPPGGKLHWHFKAPAVHDFAWAADTAYRHLTAQVPGGPLLHFFHKNDTTINDEWEKLPPYAVKCFELMKELIGAYPYEQYTVIQGGDGGMEYPMTTLIVGRIKLGGLISVTVHEAIHSWFQGLLATNEAKYAWMDEGFTTYAQHIVMDSIYHKKKKNPHSGSYSSYFSLVESGLQEPLSTHADHFITNRAYGTAAYSMGCVFLHQLGYVIGRQNLDKGLRIYFNQWQFKHPTPDDLKRIMEKISDIELDWYFDYWINSTKTIDYGIRSVEEQGNKTLITLEKKGEMPMPVDLVITLKNGEKKLYNFPLGMMMGHKPAEDLPFILMEPWPWTYPELSFELDHPLSEIETIEIDPTESMADIERRNNHYPRGKRAFRSRIVSKKTSE